MSLITIAKYLMIAGGVFLVSGGLLYLLARWNLPLFNLPGDLVIRRGNFTLVFPLATMLLLSLIVTLLLNLLARWKR